MSAPRPAASPARRSRPAQPGDVPPLVRAMTAFQKGRFEEAAGLCAALAESDPSDAAALHLLGLAELRRGRAADAVAALERAAEIEPANAELHGNLGAALRAAGKPDRAAESLARAIALRPGFAPARFNLGNALSDLGRYEAAVEAYRDTLTIDPNHVGAHNNLGLALAALGRDADAEAHFRAALALQPGQRDANLSLARLLRARGDAAAALKYFDAAQAAAPNDPAVASERGVTLVELGRVADGLAALRDAVRLAPEEAAFRVNLGVALCAAGDAETALAEFATANRLAPGSAETLANHGHALKQLGRLDEAVALYDRALEADPANREARFGRAFCRLLHGEFLRAWPDYRARESMASAGPDLWREPLSDDLSGRRVLVLRDQGIGDELFFLRFLPLLRARGAAVAYQPDPRLSDMLVRSNIAKVVSGAQNGAPYDFTVSVGDLPWLLGTAETPPSLVLHPLKDRVEMVQARLSAFGPPPYVGVTWRAGIENRKNRLFKEAPQEAIAAILRPLDFRVVVLQRGPRPGEIEGFAAALGRPVLDLSAMNADLEVMLAVVDLLDMQVCVSNTNVHLAAARNRRCRILLPHPPEFRWMAAGAESPWFPGMRIYRQAANGDWGTAFERLAADLAANTA